MRLTDITVRSLPIPEKGQRTYFDDSLPSFGCRVSQGGTRSFVVQHGHDRQLFTIGRYHPDILPLAKARTEAKRILAERVLGKHRAKSIPFDDAKTVFLEHCKQKNRPKTLRDYTGIFRRHFTFGTRQLFDITTHDIDRKLDRIEGCAEKRYATVVIKLFFKWAERKNYIDYNPCHRIETPAKSPSRARVLTDAELKTLWIAAEQTEGHFGTIVKLLILTGMRRTECASLQASYFSHNQQTICLPARLTKNKRQHTFPLGALSISIVHAASSEAHGDLLFPGRGSNSKSFCGWSKSKKALDELSGVTGWTLHDLRRTFRTNLSRLGIAPHISERLVNHVSRRDPMEDVYDLYKFLPEMRAAMDLWESYLAKLTE